MVFLKEFLKKFILKKISRQQKSMKNYPGGRELKPVKTKNILKVRGFVSCTLHFLPCSSDCMRSYMSVARILFYEIDEQTLFQRKRGITQKYYKATAMAQVPYTFSNVIMLAYKIVCQYLN